MSARLARLALAAVLVVALRPATVAAQDAVPHAALASGQRGAVLLQVRPRLGDTLRMRLDQTAEMSGTTRIGSVDSTMTVTTAMHVRTHAIVQRSDDAGTTLLSVTDSVSLSVTGSRAGPPEAMAVFEDVSAVDYAAASGRIREALSGDKIREVQLAKELADHFRAQYQHAAAKCRRAQNAADQQTVEDQQGNRHRHCVGQRRTPEILCAQDKVDK